MLAAIRSPLGSANTHNRLQSVKYLGERSHNNWSGEMWREWLINILSKLVNTYALDFQQKHESAVRVVFPNLSGEEFYKSSFPPLLPSSPSAPPDVVNPTPVQRQSPRGRTWFIQVLLKLLWVRARKTSGGKNAKIKCPKPAGWNLMSKKRILKNPQNGCNYHQHIWEELCYILF